MSTYTSRTLIVDGMKTNIIEQGSGPSVVLLHSGEYGACAEGSWSGIIPELAEAGYHVVAPDWLGFGQTDKVIDFADPTGRRMRHMAATIKALDLGPAAFVGNSMGGTYLAKAIASPTPLFDAAAAVLVSGGGFVPDNEARKQILEYDLTEEGMARILRAVTYHPTLADDTEYIRWRHQLSLTPGAWQCAASARLRPPGVAGTVDIGKKDDTNYEQIAAPTLIIAGANDPLREEHYYDELAQRIPDNELLVYPECGHLPQLEYPARFHEDLLSFLDRKFRKGLE
ncbi:alpha/beta fold hydrolase [Rhodococcus opacus]|uniref:alpha/beta fold hydrolase n=1 Tax=Rhodococcus opacus TaxID=37919 RepID=UPI002948E044|nr:alpha/beta hydrolase [Rhodococcus opacus]MDV6246316.1 alpha/beta hydrolase [Rhodococcus opacus]